MTWRGFFRLLTLAGLALTTCGAAMRAYAQLTNNHQRDVLLAARPVSPGEVWQHTARVALTPADGDPARLRLPDYGLWNTLEP
ncbi:MAG: hypothetical protein IT323_09265, partial [Anaerolineae bacterium]|nr:hypothetical protein [Anaerolineae bacterium]